MHNNQRGAPPNLTSAVYLDQDVFEKEQEFIFRGCTWNFLGMVDDVSDLGDFVSTDVGTTPVVLNRGVDGLHAFVNRCAHRGALVVRQARGRTDKHVCEMHRWSYDHAGNLLEGDGGNIGLQKLRIDSHQSVVFGTLDEGTPNLCAYLTESMSRRMDMLCARPLSALSRHRCSVKANWKLYLERLLASRGQFGIVPLYRDAAHTEHAAYHTIWTTYNEKDDCGRYRSILHRVETQGGGGVPFFSEHDGGTGSVVLFVFPTLILVKVENHLQIRQLVPKSANEFEILWTNYAYKDDSADHVQVRQAQGRLLGLNSPLSLEDAEELEAAQEALQNALSETQEPAAQEPPFGAAWWKTYRNLMEN